MEIFRVGIDFEHICCVESILLSIGSLNSITDCQILPVRKVLGQEWKTFFLDLYFFGYLIVNNITIFTAHWM